MAITVAAVSLNKIGYDASEVSVGWCWVRIHASDRVLWMLLTGKIWEFLAYLTLPVLYILIKRHIHIAVRTKQVFTSYVPTLITPQTTHNCNDSNSGVVYFKKFIFNNIFKNTLSGYIRYTCTVQCD